MYWSKVHIKELFTFFYPTPWIIPLKASRLIFSNNLIEIITPYGFSMISSSIIRNHPIRTWTDFFFFSIVWLAINNFNMVINASSCIFIYLFIMFFSDHCFWFSTIESWSSWLIFCICLSRFLLRFSKLSPCYYIPLFIVKQYKMLIMAKDHATNLLRFLQQINV